MDGGFRSQLDRRMDYGIVTKLVSKPQQVKLMRDRLNPLKASYCFVTFKDQESVDLAIQRNGQKVPDSYRTFKLNHSGKHTTGRQEHHGNAAADFSCLSVI